MWTDLRMSVTVYGFVFQRILKDRGYTDDSQNYSEMTESKDHKVERYNSHQTSPSMSKFVKRGDYSIMAGVGC